MNSTPNLEEMSHDELAHYLVADRDTPEGIEATLLF